MKSIFSSKIDLLNYLGLKENFLYTNFQKKYTERLITKKSGGLRVINPPSPNLKRAQRRILDDILSPSSHLPCVFGLSKSKGVRQNAETHLKNRGKSLLLLDIQDFFPSVTKRKIVREFVKMGFNTENAVILTKICTINNSLPQGAPTSPQLASLACRNMDKKIYSFCTKRNLIYTRYFDDICISGDHISRKTIKDIEEIVNKNSFKCNEIKKQLYGPLQEKEVNGVLLSQDGLSVTNNYKKQIRESYQTYLLEKTPSSKRIFKGKLGFYLHINKKEALGYFADLKLKFGSV